MLIYVDICWYILICHIPPLVMDFFAPTHHQLAHLDFLTRIIVNLDPVRLFLPAEEAIYFQLGAPRVPRNFTPTVWCFLSKVRDKYIKKLAYLIFIHVVIIICHKAEHVCAHFWSSRVPQPLLGGCLSFNSMACWSNNRMYDICTSCLHWISTHCLKKTIKRNMYDCTHMEVS